MCVLHCLHTLSNCLNKTGLLDLTSIPYVKVYANKLSVNLSLNHNIMLMC